MCKVCTPKWQWSSQACCNSQLKVNAADAIGVQCQCSTCYCGHAQACPNNTERLASVIVTLLPGYSEEISFYQGSAREKTILLGTLEQLVDHLRDFILFRFSMGFIDNVIAKCECVCVCVCKQLPSNQSFDKCVCQ